MVPYLTNLTISIPISVCRDLFPGFSIVPTLSAWSRSLTKMLLPTPAPLTEETACQIVLSISLIFPCDSAAESIKSEKEMDTEFIAYPSFLTQWPTILLSTSLLTRHQPRVSTRNGNSTHVPQRQTYRLIQQVHQCVSKIPILIFIISRLCDFSSPTLGMLTLFITSLSHGPFAVLL